MALQDFLSSFSNVEIARPSRFLVDINFNNPTLLGYYKNQMPGGFALRCETAELPGRTFETVEQKFGSNPSLKFPMHTSYTDISLTFLVSSDMTEKTFFDVWMEYINPSKTFDFGYKDDYSATIKVNQYDSVDNVTYSVNLLNAYPIVINQLDLDWNSDGFHKLVVVFAYDYWQLGRMEELNKSGYLPASVVASNDFGAPVTASTNPALPPPKAPDISGSTANSNLK